MKSTKTIILFTIIIMLLSCDKRKDFFEELNEAPVVLLNSRDNVGSNHAAYTTEVLDSFKLSNGTYILNILSTDESTGSKLSAYINPTGPYILNQSPPIINGENEEIAAQILFTPTVIGTYIYNVKVVDKFNIESEATAKIEVFNNLPPVSPSLIITPDPLLNIYEHKFNASACYDRDAKYGGKVVKYNWQVDANYNVETEFNIIKYIFPWPGSYVVRVRCQDNDGAWSPFISKTFIVI
ncbi:MAG: hypothetical protein COB15_12000 [Flavobacteriales bacterium]|nr:MAG: hypothetical protein COB15_12000 [Flavobacteriales bacterium]